MPEHAPRLHIQIGVVQPGLALDVLQCPRGLIEAPPPLDDARAETQQYHEDADYRHCADERVFCRGRSVPVCSASEWTIRYSTLNLGDWPVEDMEN